MRHVDGLKAEIAGRLNTGIVHVNDQWQWVTARPQAHGFPF